MITNRKDAITKLMEVNHLYAHSDRFATFDEVTFSKEVFEELEKDKIIKLISEDATTATAVYTYMPIEGRKGHITNVPDALTELYSGSHIIRHQDGTITTKPTVAWKDGATVSEEVFEKLKEQGRIRLIKDEVYESVPPRGGAGCPFSRD